VLIADLTMATLGRAFQTAFSQNHHGYQFWEV
jgi:hypothetical protein